MYLFRLRRSIVIFVAKKTVWDSSHRHIITAPQNTSENSAYSQLKL